MKILKRIKKSSIFSEIVYLYHQSKETMTTCMSALLKTLSFQMLAEFLTLEFNVMFKLKKEKKFKSLKFYFSSSDSKFRVKRVLWCIKPKNMPRM